MSILIRLFPYLAVVVGVFVVGYCIDQHGFNRGSAEVQAKWDKAKIAQVVDQGKREREARQKEQALLDVVDMIETEKNHEKAAANARYAAVVAELRNRKEPRASATSGVPTSSTPETGCTGAGLAGPDARFLAGYAADAKRLSIALSRCVQSYQEVYEAFKVTEPEQQNQ